MCKKTKSIRQKLDMACNELNKTCNVYREETIKKLLPVSLPVGVIKTLN
jgi:hypothetical protein